MSKVIFTNRLPGMISRMKSQARTTVLRTAQAIEANAKADMARAKSGEMYGSHRASAPGEPPAIDTGNLAGSVFAVMIGEATAITGVSAEYAEYLEFGTARVAARPFLTPAAEMERNRFIQACAALFK